MNKLIILTSHFLPENTACTNRMISLVEVASINRKVVIYSLTQPGCDIPENPTCFNENVTVNYVGQSYYNKNNFFIRAFNELKHCFRLVRKVRSDTQDTVFVTIPYMFFIPFVLFTKGKKVLDIRDLVWEYLPNKNFFSKLIKYLLGRFFYFCISKYHVVCVTNENELTKVRDFSSNNSIQLVPNGVSKSRFYLLSLTKLNQEPFKKVLYVGNVGLAQNLLLFVKAAKELPSFIFDIVGGGLEVDFIKKYLIDNDIKNVNLHGKLDWSDLIHFYNDAHVLYAGLDAHFASAVPSKLYEYAATGKPIIYSGIGQATNFVNNLEYSYSIHPDDTVSLVSKLNYLSKTPPPLSKFNRKLIHDKYIREECNERLLLTI